jgi:hypothetical protein
MVAPLGTAGYSLWRLALACAGRLAGGASTGLWNEVDVNVEEGLLRPAALHSAESVLTRPCPVPAAAGVYGWYFSPPPPSVPAERCHAVSDSRLLYVGISPKAPRLDGLPGSRQTLRSRIRYHYRGNAEGSTLRLTLGCLLADQLGIELRRVGSGKRLTFGVGEARLSEWMARHAWVVWAVTERQWEVEERLLRELVLPLHLDQNKHSAFHQELSVLRAEHRTRARALPIM